MKRLTYDPLVALLQTLEDGIEFYRIAEQKALSSQLQAVFAQMAEVREFALAYIKPYLQPHRLEFEQFLTYHGTLSNRYAPLLDDVLGDEQLALVRQIEEHLIDAMLTAAQETQNALVESILQNLSVRIRQNISTHLPPAPPIVRRPRPRVRGGTCQQSGVYSEA